MKITRTSPLTGELNEMDLDISQDQVIRYRAGIEHIQNIFPNLESHEREFIMTGYTKEDWDTMFPEEDEEL